MKDKKDSALLHIINYKTKKNRENIKKKKKKAIIIISNNHKRTKRGGDFLFRGKTEVLIFVVVFSILIGISNTEAYVYRQPFSKRLISNPGNPGYQWAKLMIAFAT